MRRRAPECLRVHTRGVWCVFTSVAVRCLRVPPQAGRWGEGDRALEPKHLTLQRRPRRRTRSLTHSPPGQAPQETRPRNCVLGSLSGAERRGLGIAVRIQNLENGPSAPGNPASPFSGVQGGSDCGFCRRLGDCVLWG